MSAVDYTRVRIFKTKPIFKMPNKNGNVVFGILIFLIFLTMLVFSLFVKTEFSLIPLLIPLIPIVFILAFIDTDNALIILIFSMLLSPELHLGGIYGRAIVLRLDDIFLLMVFFGWFAKMAVHKELGLLRKNPVNKFILIYITLCVISSAVGILRGTTNLKHSFFYILKYIEYFLLFFMVSNNIKDKKQVRIFISFMLLTCLVVSVYALRVSFADGMRASAPFEGRSGEANTLAGYLILMMGIVLGFLLYSRSIKLRILLGVFFMFLTLPFLFTLSRGGWLGFFAMYLTFIVLSKRHKVFLLLFLILILMFSSVIFPKAIQGRFQATFAVGKTYVVLGRKITLDESAQARIRSWEGSMKAWSEYPILGRGVPGGGSVSDVQYTRVLREVGILGFLAFMLIIITLMQLVWRVFSNPRLDDFGKSLSLGFLCAFVGLVVMGLSAEVFIILRIMEPFWFLAAIVTTLPEISTQQLPEEASG